MSLNVTLGSPTSKCYVTNLILLTVAVV